MRRERRPNFEGLEARQLLTAAHAAPSHAVHAEVVVPLALDGTLAVNPKGLAVTTDVLGDVFRTTPVAGVLDGAGKVAGTWTEAANAYGQPLAADTLQLHNAQGSFVVSFETRDHGKPHETAAGMGFAPLPQHMHGGTRAYARAAEVGTIAVDTDAAGKTVTGMTLATRAG